MNSEDWRNATPEQSNLWRIASALIAWNTVTPICYEGAIAGSEFLTYNAAKLYIALELEFISNLNPGSIPANAPLVTFYDIANAVNHYSKCVDYFYDSAGATAYMFINNLKLTNMYFSRFVVAGYINVKFNGYRLTTI